MKRVVQLGTMAALAWSAQFLPVEEGPWAGTRSIVLLPLVLPAELQSNAEAKSVTTLLLRQALSGTKKFELVAIHPHNPAIARALEEGGLRQADVDAAISQPSVDTYLQVAAAVGVDWVVEPELVSFQPADADKPFKVEFELRATDVTSGDVAMTGKGVGETAGVLETAAQIRQMEMFALNTAIRSAVERLLGIPEPPPPPKPKPKAQPKPKPKPKPAAKKPAPKKETKPAPKPAEPEKKKESPPTPLSKDPRHPSTLPTELMRYFLGNAAMMLGG